MVTDSFESLCGCYDLNLGPLARATSALKCISPSFGILSEQSMLTDISRRSFKPSDLPANPYLVGRTKSYAALDAPGRADVSSVTKKPEAEW